MEYFRMYIKSIESIREQIDTIDTQLVRLIVERQKFVTAATKLKKNQADVRAPDRVNAVIQKVKLEAMNCGLSQTVVEAVYRSMINAFIEYELEQHKEVTS